MPGCLSTPAEHGGLRVARASRKFFGGPKLIATAGPSLCEEPFGKQYSRRAAQGWTARLLAFHLCVEMAVLGPVKHCTCYPAHASPPEARLKVTLDQYAPPDAFTLPVVIQCSTHPDLLPSRCERNPHGFHSKDPCRRCNRPSNPLDRHMPERQAILFLTKAPSSRVASLRQNEGSSEQFQGSFSIGIGKLRVPTTQAPHYFGVPCHFYLGAPLSRREAPPSKRRRSPIYTERIPTCISALPQNEGSFPQILPRLSSRSSELRVPDGKILPKTAGLRALFA